jgi:diguanylate cyclase (GGDEF)-like protein/PAS domain S-box-containing protein
VSEENKAGNPHNSSDRGGLALGEDFLSELLNASEHILFRIDLVRGGYDFISPVAAEIYGFSLEELHERGLYLLLNEQFDPDEVARFRKHVLDLCREAPGQSIRTAVEYRLKNARGEMVWHSNSMTLVSGPDGRPLSASGITIDVTARRKYEMALRESEEQYRATMDALHVGVFAIQDQKFRFVNPKFCEMFGYSEEECVNGLGPVDMAVAEQREMLIDRMRRRAAGERGDPYEVIGLRKDGSRFPVMVFGEPSHLNGRPASVGTLIDLSAQRQVEQALKDASKRYALLFESAQDAILLADVDSGRIVDANVKAEEMFLRTREEMIGMHQSEFHLPEQARCYREMFARHVAAGCGGPDAVDVLTAEGELIPVDLSTNVIETSDGQRLIQGVFRDVRQRRQDEMALKRAALVFETSQESIILTDADANIVSVNHVFEEMSGYSADEVIGKNPRLLNSGRHTPAFYAAMWQDITSKGKWQGEVWNRRKSGEVFPVWLKMSVYRGADGKVLNYVGVAADISERLAAQEHIRQLAYFDPLTRLPNRRLLQDRAGQALASAERENKHLALLFIDLDQFKTINDSLGHSAGDQLLCEVARRLLACVRRMDTVARLGGDEFVVLLAETSLDGAAEVARKILQTVARPHSVDGHQLGVTPSLGISVYPQDGRDFETLLKHADTAMYRAKESGRNAYQFFTNEMNVAALERMLLENSLRQAMARGEFVVHYQPQIDLTSRRIIGAEALVRWLHPEIGLISPGKFIPVAEASGLIVPIGQWVLREACRQNRAWQDAGLPPICIAVNISSVQFRGGQLEDTVRSALDETGMAAELLELELTEGIVMGSAEETIDILHRLSDMGLKLAIDDFGTGYSSLSYLKRFPIDKLKIDQSFVRDIASDPDDWAIARAVIGLGHSLRLTVIAEGVETAEQLSMLKREGCDEVQGYHFSIPLPADEFAGLLRQERFSGKD